MTDTAQAARSAPSPGNVLLAGASGYIGRAVARELVSRGHRVFALLRPGADRRRLEGCEPLVGDVTNPDCLRQALQGRPMEAVVSCLASRSGVPDDAWRVDHSANGLLLREALRLGAGRFVLLSAICVQKPRLAFQQAKLAFEAELRAAPLEHVIVRPTAFFKSLAGQVERVRQGRPFLLFGDGRLTACKPISEADLARYLADCVVREDRADRTLPIGGPGPAITPRQQGEWLFELTGQPVRFRSVPPGILRGAAGVLGVLGRLSGAAARKAELARIGHYYATESMLAWDETRGCYDARATPETGQDTLRDFYRMALERGLQGQELGEHKLFS